MIGLIYSVFYHPHEESSLFPDTTSCFLATKSSELLFNILLFQVEIIRLWIWCWRYSFPWASWVALVVKNLPANAGDLRKEGLIPGLGHPLEEGMATHSSILAWRIPWTEEPGGLQSIGSQRVRHDWSDLAQHYSFPSHASHHDILPSG